MRIFLFSALLLFSFTTCKKDVATFTIRGQIMDNTNSVGLANASIQIFQLAAGSGENTLIKDFFTDANGNYSFTIDRDQFSYLTFKITKNNYFPIEEIVYFSDLTTAEDNIRNFSTTGKSWAKVHLTGSSPSSDLDITKTAGKTGCSECCPAGFQSYNGNFDITFYCINDANTPISYTYLANGGGSSGTLSEITPMGDTVLIELHL